MEPRIVFDEPDRQYRDTPAAHYSGLKKILDCPARYDWERRHPKTRREYDRGHIVHGIVLGVGDPVHVIDADTWRGNAAKAEAEQARERGEIPVLAAEHAQAEACAEAVLAHPLAGPILTSEGASEVSVYWTDDETGTPCKARIDRHTITADGTHWLIDLKTTGQSANPDTFGNTAARYGYHLQAAFYIDGYCTAAGVTVDEVQWLNIVVETEAPHLVSVNTLDAEALNAGRESAREALTLYRDCTETGVWPGYTLTEAATVTLPRYATRPKETTP